MHEIVNDVEWANQFVMNNNLVRSRLDLMHAIWFYSVFHSSKY